MSPLLEPITTTAESSTKHRDDSEPFNPVSALFSAVSSKLYSKGHLEASIEQIDSQIPYPSIFNKQQWTPVVASLRGTVLKLVVAHGTKYTEQFTTTGAIVDRISITGKNAAFRLILTTSCAKMSLIFACASLEKLDQWIASFLWSSWERARMDEIYTASILKQVVCEKGTVSAEMLGIAPTTLNEDGVIEGYVFVQLDGQPPDSTPLTLWLTAGYSDSSVPPPSHYSRSSVIYSASGPETTLNLYTSHKGKGRKEPLVAVSNVTQAYISRDRWGNSPIKRGCIMLYGLISQSTEGEVDGERSSVSHDTKKHTGWISIEPDERGNGCYHNILDWLIAIHDVVGLYGRPKGWIWDATNPRSMDFGLTSYPPGRSVMVSKRLVDGLILSNPLVQKDIHQQFDAMLLARMTEIVFSDVPETSPAGESSDIQSPTNPFSDLMRATKPTEYTAQKPTNPFSDLLEASIPTDMCSAYHMSPSTSQLEGSDRASISTVEGQQTSSPPPHHKFNEVPTHSLDGHSDCVSIYHLP